MIRFCILLILDDEGVAPKAIDLAEDIQAVVTLINSKAIRALDMDGLTV